MGKGKHDIKDIKASIIFVLTLNEFYAYKATIQTHAHVANYIYSPHTLYHHPHPYSSLIHASIL